MTDFGQQALEEATRRQRAAAQPDTSVWVTASAGSGKTKVLTDRVLNLLLSGCPAGKILCLTFTKAAAAEMANRLAKALARWPSLEEEELARQIEALTGRPVTAEVLARARLLFAEVLDAPGGMKIQTIHAFCQALLARFPLEAGVAPHTKVVEEQAAAELLQAARLSVLSRSGANPTLAAAIGRIAALCQEDTFGDLMAALVSERSRLQRALRRQGGVEGAVAALYRALEVAPGTTPDMLVAAAVEEAALDRPGLERVQSALQAGSKTDQNRAAQLRDWLKTPPAERHLEFEAYQKLFLTAKGAVLQRLMTKGAKTADPGSEAIMAREALRLAACREAANRARVAEANAALLRLGAAILEAYETAKKTRALFDYDDLILSARDLLTASGAAAWVLYKLDGGLDHILIDEAQDTNPEQWQVVQALTEEFFAGAGAQAEPRTLFVVGDAKQSIYSFQRADPATFAAMRESFAARIQAADKAWAGVELGISFRSTTAVLGTVDAVFDQPAARPGVVFEETALRHQAARAGQPGLVELWPAEEPPGEEDGDWDLPAEPEEALPARSRLAHRLAERIHYWVQDPAGASDPDCRLPARDRRMTAGDILVLVRRRGAFVEEFVRALKTLEVPVVGVDRMVLSEQLAVQDLIALGRVMLLPEDDLTLACLLKSPLFDLSEEALFDLAWKRPGTLWAALGKAAAKAGAASSLRAAWETLTRLRDRAAFGRPYEFFAEVLGPLGGRRRLLARLGPEAADPLEEFLGRALLHERENIPSLQGFLAWLDAAAQEIKRDMELNQAAVRVMTVHGAKGLQAPVVVLPDTLQTPAPGGGANLLWPREGGGIPLWPVHADYACDPVRGAKAERQRLQAEEYRRLLYVAMTRAEDRLYVGGWHTRVQAPEDCWYHLIRQGLASLPEAVDSPEGATIRFAPGGAAPDPNGDPSGDPSDSLPARAVEVPAWARRSAPAEPQPPRPLSPARPSAPEPAVVSPLTREGASRFQRGLRLHRLLQLLPDVAPAERKLAGQRLLAAEMESEAAAAALVAEALEVLEAPRFQHLFGPDSRAEVPITGLVAGRDGAQRVVSGQVDRLVTAPGSISIVDYKTNRPPPVTTGKVPPLYLGQMAAYRAVLRQIFPGRPIACYLLWTASLDLMALPEDALDAYAP